MHILREEDGAQTPAVCWERAFQPPRDTPGNKGSWQQYPGIV